MGAGYVGILSAELHFPEAHSLKEKRMHIRSAKEKLKDPWIGFVTVTGAKASQDLRQATVYVSVFGGEKKRSASMGGLDRAHGVLQARISRELRMQRTPLLTFEYDHAAEHGVRMSKLIDELAPRACRRRA